MEDHAAQSPAWLVHKHGDPVLSNLDPDVQDLMNSVGWRDGLTLCPEDAAIKEARNIKIV